MDIVTIMKKRNAEYLKLIHDSQDTESSLSKKLNDIVQEINRLTNLYAAKIELISRELDEKIEQTISQSEDDIRSTWVALKKKRNAISQNEEQRQSDIKVKYEKIFDEIEATHAKELKNIELIYTRQMQDNENDYQLNAERYHPPSCLPLPTAMTL